MRFQVPQFIDIEDKIFGPFTFLQFSFLVGGAGIIFVLYKILPFFISIFLILPVAALTVCLVFVKINSKPFIYYLEAAFNYMISSKLYVWKQRLVKKSDHQEEDLAVPTTVSNVPMLSENKLKDLSWSLDVQDRKDNQV
ncbi:PrgI family protein [Candidatus Nomurabacteria bacterium]|nr:PrgI family protein [Candidatus Nomurabacteria bacterium]